MLKMKVNLVIFSIFNLKVISKYLIIVQNSDKQLINKKKRTYDEY
jgi:hypothetical protein